VRDVVYGDDSQAEICVWEGSRLKTAEVFKLSYHIIMVRDPNPRHSENDGRCIRMVQSSVLFSSEPFLMNEVPLHNFCR
jgi:hypothetical protein